MCFSHFICNAPQEREHGNSPTESSTPVLASVNGKIGKENTAGEDYSIHRVI